jgi:hypothetical protein
MKHALLISLAATVFVANGFAQGRIYRCGNEYTNAVPAGQKGCKLLEGGNVTVVKGTRVSAAPMQVAAATQSGQRVDSAQQRSRDAEARLILESELRKAETRREELTREYNGGEPEILGPEARNHQKYLDRVAELKASLERTDNDIAGIRRELARVPASQ